MPTGGKNVLAIHDVDGEPWLCVSSPQVNGSRRDVQGIELNTPSHFLITLALGAGLSRRRDFPWRAVLLGSIAPDVALWVLSIGAIVYFTQVIGVPAGATFSHIYGWLYFHDPGWIAAHNLLHAPLLLVPTIILLGRRESPWARWAAWFLASCLLHALVDFATHFDDGPLLYFPLDWATRVHSPVSYWDPAHHGLLFSRFELALDVVIVAAAVAYRVRTSRLSAAAVTGSSASPPITHTPG